MLRASPVRPGRGTFPRVKAVVTGGGDFLGRHLVSALLERGERVVSYSRGPYPALAEKGATCVQGDLSDRDTLRRAFRGNDVVVHAAAKAGIWGDAKGSPRDARGRFRVGS